MLLFMKIVFSGIDCKTSSLFPCPAPATFLSSDCCGRTKGIIAKEKVHLKVSYEHIFSLCDVLLQVL